MSQLKKVKDNPDLPGHQPAKYYTGMSKLEQLKREKHFKKASKMSSKDPDAYQPAPGDQTKSTTVSKYTKLFKQMYGEELELYEIAGLKNKAKKSGVSYGILKKVYDRGMAAWRTGHRPGTTPQQWAMARVNSYITKGKTYHTADKDLREEQIDEQYVNEELTPKQKQTVSKWKRDPVAIAQTDHYFGVGNDEKQEEMQGASNKSEPHKAVENHLGHEISHEDYKAGLTTDKYGRRVKIGALLQKSKAPPELINGFANDSTRQLKRQNKLSVLVTRSAHGVAGQTSSGQSWEEESCKNFKDGSNKSYLKPEVEHGTVVAYLKNEQGHELARATFQPHHDGQGNVIYAHNSYYGPRVREFEDHLHGLARRLSSPNAPKTGVYRIHKDVYNDKGAEHATIFHPDVSSEDLHKAFDHKDPNVRRAAASNPNATSEQLHKALNDKDYSVRRAAITNPNATSEHLHKALNDKVPAVVHHAISQGRLDSSHIDKLLSHKDPYIRKATIKRANVTSLQIHRALEDQHVEVRAAAASNPNATSEHLDKALSDRDPNVRGEAAQHPNATSEQLHKALNDRFPSVKLAAVNNPNATDDHLNKAEMDKDKDVKSAAKAVKKMRSNAEKATTSVTARQTLPESVKNLLHKNREKNTNSSISNNKKVTPEQIDELGPLVVVPAAITAGRIAAPHIARAMARNAANRAARSAAQRGARRSTTQQGARRPSSPARRAGIAGVAAGLAAGLAGGGDQNASRDVQVPSSQQVVVMRGPKSEEKRSRNPYLAHASLEVSKTSRAFEQTELDNPNNRLEGTTAVRKLFQRMTPGQENVEFDLGQDTIVPQDDKTNLRRRNAIKRFKHYVDEQNCNCDCTESLVEEEALFEEKKVTLNKPFRTPGGPKKFSVYVKNDKGNVVKVNFGDPNLSIKRDQPNRRKSFRARHNCDNPGPKWKARYWSCRMWAAKPVSNIV